jgi:polysaccharide export outer membrane protein
MHLVLLQRRRAAKHPSRSDINFVPDAASGVVFVFGRGQSKGTTVPLVNGRLSILQALAASGMACTDHSQGKSEKVRVLRGEGDRAQFFVVKAEKILQGYASPFMLESGDLVFGPETGWTKWKQIINQFLPTLQLISGLLNPYVQLKYLGGF